MIKATNKMQMKICTTCLSLGNFEFLISEDMKGILRSLLYECGFDEFLHAIPPDKQLTLCNVCNQTLQDIIVFKERAQKSFNEFKKYWCVNMPKRVTVHTVAVPSSSQTENGTPCDDIKIEDPKELKCEEPDPLEIIKRDPEGVVNSNIYDTFIDIKEETDKNTIPPTNEKLIKNYVNYNVATNNKQKNIFNLNLSTGNSCTINAAPDSYDLENTIQSSLLINSASVLPVVYDMATLNNLNSSITSNSHTGNSVPTTNPNDQNNKSIFKRVSMDNGQVVLGSSNKKMKIVQMDNIGNIENVGHGIIFNPVPLSKANLIVQVDCGSAKNSIPNTKEDNTQNAVYNGGISASDSKSDREFPSDDGNRMKINGEKVDLAVILENLPVRGIPAVGVQKKWYIRIVTREEILKQMEESRNHPDFLAAPHKCDSCVALFTSEMLAETHKKAYHSEDYELTCFACLRTFKELHVLRSHYREHTNDKTVYRCITCEFETRGIGFIRCHICPNAGSKPLPPKDPKTMRLSKCASLYYCHRCEFVSTRSTDLTRHYDMKHTKTHKIACRVKCDECGKSYANKDGLRVHVDHVHKGKKRPEEPVYCNICNKWFSAKTTLYSHMKNIHTPIEHLRFPCDECKKKFLTAKQLDTHKKLHACLKGGVKNHKCDVCGNAYYTRQMLRRHKKSSHNKPTSRDHVCEVCGQAFFDRQTLKKHTVKHSDARPYKCTHCGDTFKFTASLYTHTKLKHKKKKSEDTPIKENSEKSSNKANNSEKPSKKEKNSEKSPKTVKNSKVLPEKDKGKEMRKRVK